MRAGDHIGAGAVVDDPSLFLSVAQVRSLVTQTPWPYNILVHLAAWSGLRAAEPVGLQVGDVILPPKPVNPNAPAKPATVLVRRTVAWVGGELTTVAPKTKGSRRDVPQTAETTAMLRDYLKVHPSRDEPTTPLFLGLALAKPQPTGIPVSGIHREVDNGDQRRSAALRQATALADLTVQEAGEQIVLDWTQPYRHATFYKATYRPAVIRANRVAAAVKDETAKLTPQLKFHALRQTYASLMIAAGRPMFEVA